MKEGRLEGRVALVTGASRGIGAAVAKRFGEEGAHVIMVARTVGGMEEVDDAIQAAGGTSTIVPLDLTEHEKIDELALRIAERFKHLDILVGNAAVLGSLGPLTHTDNKVWNKIVNVNISANFYLLRAFDNLLKASPAGRAMFVTSGVTRGVSPYWGPYALSKAALEVMVKTYAAENAKTNVRANLIDPGIVRTKMRAAAFPGENPDKLTPPENITETFVKLAEYACKRNGEVVGV